MIGETYNMRIRFRSATSPTEFRFRVTLDFLKEIIVNPYLDGHHILLDGRIINPQDISQINIKAINPPLSNPNIMQRVLDRIWYSRPPTAFEGEGIDVTEDFIYGPPGSGISQHTPSTLSEIPLTDLFDALISDQQIRLASRKLFIDKHYTSAVEKAFVCVNNAVKDQSGRTATDGADLMRTVFSANSPILKLNAFQTRTEKDEQQGYMDIFAGCMTGIRNPRAHEHNLADKPEVALELITLANHLMRMLNAATKTKPEAPIL